MKENSASSSKFDTSKLEECSFKFSFLNSKKQSILQSITIIKKNKTKH